MTLFFVTPDLYFGGAERVMALLMNQFCQDGDTVILAIMNNREAYPIAYHLDENVKMLFISPFRRNSLKHIVAPLRELRNKIRCYEPDVVVSFFPDTATLTYLAGFGMGFPMVYSERNDPKNNVKGFLRRGQVAVDSKVVTAFDWLLHKGERVTILRKGEKFINTNLKLQR